MVFSKTSLFLASALVCVALLLPSAGIAADKKVEPPPTVDELEPITVEGKRIEDEITKKVDPEKRLKEELEKDKKAIEEIKDARGNGRVRVKSPLYTYCLDYNQNPLLQNNVGNTLIVPTYCGPGSK